MTYTMGSLFAGIGGFDLGFERAGFKTSWQVEIDPYCQKVLAKNFPEAERFGDIRECGSHNLKAVDVICGGFPCQDISNAGLRAGIEGERSGLWKEYARIIRELRPKFVLVENVAALLGRGMGVVLGDLAEIGYDAEWEVISAADVGAPHLRERVWILAYACGNNAGCWAEQFKSGKSSNRESSQFLPNTCGRSREAYAGGDNTPCGEGFHWFELEGCSNCGISRDEVMADAEFKQQDRWGDWTCGWEREPQEALRDARGRGRQEAWMSVPESRLGRVAYGIPAIVDRLRGLGNAVVPQIPEMIARRINQALEVA